MLIGKKAIPVDEIEQYTHVQMEEDIAEMLTTHLKDLYEELFDDSLVVPKGIWKVDNVQSTNLPQIQGLALWAQPYRIVIISKDDWDNMVGGNSIPIVYTKDSQALMGASSSFLLSDVLKPAFLTLKEFSNINSIRGTCVICNNKLNIITQNLHICTSGCEDSFKEE